MNTLASPPPPAPQTETPPHARSAQEWERHLAKFRVPDARRSVLQLLVTAALFVVGWWAMVRSLEVSYALTLVLALGEAGLLVRLFIFLHDCAHGSYFRSARVNHVVGSLIGIVTLTPYRYWRRTHLLHHATTGNLDRRGWGDIATLTVREYLALSPLRRLAYRLLRHPAVFLLLGPIWVFLLKHRLPLDMPFSWRREWRGILVHDLGLAALVALLVATVGWKTLVAVHLPVFYFSTVAGIWLFFIQHQYEGTYWQRTPQWDFAKASIAGSSWLDLPRPLRWATGDIGLHHIHHLCSAIPNYRLAECMAEVRDIPPPQRLTLGSSLGCASLVLWDEDAQRMIRFRDLPAARARATAAR